MRFSIRDVLWLTVVVALGCGWFVEHRQQVDLRSKHAKIQSELIRSHQTEAQRARESEAALRLRQSARVEHEP